MLLRPVTGRLGSGADPPKPKLLWGIGVRSPVPNAPSWDLSPVYAAKDTLNKIIEQEHGSCFESRHAKRVGTMQEMLL